MSDEQRELPGVEPEQPKTRARKLPCGCAAEGPWSPATVCVTGERLLEERERLRAEDEGSEEFVDASAAFSDHLSGKKPKKRAKVEIPRVTCECCGGIVYSDSIKGHLVWCNYCDGIRTRIAEDATVALLHGCDRNATDPAKVVDFAVRCGELLAKRLRGKATP